MKKYILTKTTKEYLGTTLFQIKANISFGNVTKGELGGYVEKEENLSQDGDAWVYGSARVYGDAQVYGSARVYGNAQVYGDAWVYGSARVYGDAQVYGSARVYGNAQVYGELKLLAGFFFGTRYKKEEIKYVPVDEDNELVCKGEIKLGEDEPETKNPKEITIDGAVYVLKENK